MRRLPGMPLFVLALVPLVSAAANGPAKDGWVRTEWRSVTGEPKPPHTLRERAARPGVRAGASVIRAMEERGPNGRVAVVVDEPIYPAVRDSLKDFLDDLQSAGYSTVLSTFGAGSAFDLRAHLAGLYGEEGGLVGAILVGDLPCLTYEVMQEGSRGTHYYDDFPCDLFYMDLDGEWGDQTDYRDVRAGNKKYDTGPDDVAAEIWVSRIKTDDLPALGSEVDLMNRYFVRDRLYRRRELAAPGTATLYIDDDWVARSDRDATAVAKLYGAGAVRTMRNPSTTRACHYTRECLQRQQELLFLRCHGCPYGHVFGVPGDPGSRPGAWVLSWHYAWYPDTALFYSLFVCGGCDFTAHDCLGAIAAFGGGLAAWGSAESGGMCCGNAFYSRLHEGDSFGEALKTWLNEQLRTDPYGSPYWVYGTVLLGDGTLRPSPTMWSASQ
jgi:hypothetical protein